MPSSSASTHQLGRQFWSSFRDSFESLLWQAPASTRRHAQRSSSRLGFGQSFSTARSRPSREQPPSSFFRHRLFGTSAGIPGRLLGYGNSYVASRFSPNNVRRSCTSGGLLLLGLSSPSSSSSTVVATCTAVADTALSGAGVQKAGISRLARQACQQQHEKCQHQIPQYDRLIFGVGKSQRGVYRILRETRRCKSTKSGGASSRQVREEAADKSKIRETDLQQKPAAAAEQTRTAGQQDQQPPSQPPPGPGDSESIASSMSKYLQSHLPKIPHRPTKEELLAAATGFWQRLTVRLKWFSIRSMRPWNADEWGAFVSWFMLGHLVWILVGTTTFVSLVIFTINTVFAQEKLAKWVGDYLTQSAGVTVVFESAIVPKWKDGVITFHNVFVSRRPGQIKSSVMKGSSTSAAAVAAARHTQTDQAAAAGDGSGPSSEEIDDGNYTQFDVTINSVDVTLSFLKWWNGKGMLKDVEVKGVRGVVDRTFVRWSPGLLDPLSFRHEHQPGDFEIERFKLEDLMVTVHQPGGFRPFSVSIFSCELPQLRKQWLFYDFLSANHVSGAFDGSLFTIHPRQVQHQAAVVPGSMGVTATAAAMATDVVDHSHHNINNPIMAERLSSPETALAWKKFSRLRIDGLKIDHLNRGDPGPFGWIYEGNVDIVADVMFPAEADESIVKVMSDFYDKMEEAVTSNRYIRILDGNYNGDSSTWQGSRQGAAELDVEGSFIPEWEKPQGHLAWDDAGTETKQAAVVPAAAPTPTESSTAPSPDVSSTPVPAAPATPAAVDPLPQYVIMDLRLHLNDVRAAVPFFPASDSLGHSRTQSYVNAQLIRPIVAYINAKRTYIPISCRIVKHLSDFDGSWTIYDCGLMDDASAEVYAAFARDVEDQQSRVRRLKKVGFWTLSMVVHALLAGVAGDLM